MVAASRHATGCFLWLFRRFLFDEMRQQFPGCTSISGNSPGMGVILRDLYVLKNTLSLFMLLPALYLQARDGTSVYKKSRL